MMDDPMFLSMVIGVGVIVADRRARPGDVRLVRQRWPKSGSRAHGRPTGHGAKKQISPAASWLRPAAIDLGRPSFWTKLVPNAENLNLLYEQADVNLTFNSFMAHRGRACAWPGLVFGLVFRLPILRGAPGRGAFWPPCRSSGCSGGSRSGSSSSSTPCPKPSS